MKPSSYQFTNPIVEAFCASADGIANTGYRLFLPLFPNLQKHRLDNCFWHPGAKKIWIFCFFFQHIGR